MRLKVRETPTPDYTGMRCRPFPLWIASLAITGFFTGCTDHAPTGREENTNTRSFLVTGIVRAPLADGQVIIAHEDIPGFMPAMTMPFYVAQPGDAIRLQAGDRVRFRFVVGDSSHAERFEIIGRETTAPAVATVPNTSSSSPVVMRPPRLKVGEWLPELALIDQHGTEIHRTDLAGRLTLLTFIFTRCPVPEFCPAISQRFAWLQAAIASDPDLAGQVQLLSITLDPTFDQPEILRAYGEAMNADFDVWRFATGEPSHIASLARTFSVFTERNGGVLDHTLSTALIGTNGRVQELWRGNGWTSADVLDAMRATLASDPDPSVLSYRRTSPPRRVHPRKQR